VSAQPVLMGSESVEASVRHVPHRTASNVLSTETSAQPVRRVMESAAVSVFPVPTTDA
jgi:hypothetical protein